MKNIIVVGATGFIGYELTLELMERGNQVYGIGPATIDFLSELKLDYIGRSSLFEYKTFEDLEKINKDDTLIYCPGRENGDQNSDTLKQFQSCLSYCLNKHIKMIFISSLQVFGELKENITEFTPIAPIDEYGLLKAKQEEELFKKQESLDYIIIRVPDLYGPWQPLGMLFADLLEGKKFDEVNEELCGDVLYINDAVKGIISSLERFNEMKVVHLGSGRKKQKYVGAKYIIGNALKDTCESYSNISIKVAKEKLNFNPNVRLQEGISAQKKQQVIINRAKELF